MAKRKRKTKEEKLDGLMQFLNRKAKYMRNQGATKWELILKQHFSDLHYKFKCQVPVICREKYGYILDFLLTDYNIIIEADSKQHHTSKEDVKKDNIRSRRLKKEGYHMLRLTNKQISTYTKETIDQIIKQKISLIKLQENE